VNKFFVLILTFVTINILPAADFSFSAGAGGSLDGLFSRYTLKADGQIEGEPVNVNASQKMNMFNYGGFLFADATWVEFNVGIQGGRYNYDETMIAVVDSTDIDDIVINSKGKGTQTMLSLALFGKYPFTLSEKLALFPLLGFEYQISLKQEREPNGYSKPYDRSDPIRGESDVNNKAYKLSTWNSMFIIIGGGIDYNLTSRLYLRGELLYSFRLMTPYEKDSLEKAKKGVNADNPKLGGLTSGPSLKIAAGWRFI